MDCFHTAFCNKAANVEDFMKTEAAQTWPTNFRAWPSFEPIKIRPKSAFEQNRELLPLDLTVCCCRLFVHEARKHARANVNSKFAAKAMWPLNLVISISGAKQYQVPEIVTNNSHALMLTNSRLT